MMLDPETNQLLHDIERAMGKLYANFGMMSPGQMGNMPF